MKTMSIAASSRKATLKPLLNQMLIDSLPAAVRNRSFIINDVPAEFEFFADTDRISNVLSGLLTTFVTYASDSCIRISAENIYGNMVQVSVEDNNSNHTYAVACALQKLVPLAEEIGGHLNITNRRQKITTISFIFPVMDEKQVFLTLQGAA